MDSRHTLSSEGREQGPRRAPGLLGCLVQFGWTFGGSGALLIAWITILRERAWTFTFKDALYWTLVAGMIVARYVDVARFGGNTLDGVPATNGHVFRYASIVILVSAVAWGVAQSVKL